MHIPKGEHTDWCREYSCEGCVEDSFDAGYAACRNTAFKTIEALEPYPMADGNNWLLDSRQVLDAIRDLREEE